MNLKFASIVTASREEYPPHVTDVLYMGGCPLKCGYCFVPELLHTRTCGEKSVTEIAAYFSKKNAHAVSIKGGEPFQQGNALLELLKSLKSSGIRTKAETSGFYPESVRNALEWLDYLCVDVKTELQENAYGKITQSKGDVTLMQLLKTLAFIESTPYPVFKEIRMTVVPGMNDHPDIVENVASYVSKYCDLFVLQQFQPAFRLAEPSFESIPETPKEKLAELAMVARNLIQNVAVRTGKGVQFIQ